MAKVQVVEYTKEFKEQWDKLNNPISDLSRRKLKSTNRQPQIGQRATGVAKYKSFFTAINTSNESDNKITIVNGRGISNPICGSVIVGIQTIGVAREEFSVTGNGYILSKTIYNTETELYESTLENSTEVPSELNIVYYVICSYSVSGGTLSISQSWEDGNIYLNGVYWT